MAQYSPRSFMRQVSNELLQRYFEHNGFDLGLDWNEIDETGIEPIYDAWIGLSEQQRTSDADFTDVSHLANEAGLGVPIQEGAWHNLDLAAEFAKIEDQTDCVMWTSLEHPKVFRVGSLLYAADSIASRSWHKWRGLPHDVPRDDVGGRTALADALCAYFTRHEGRGRHCQVEVYQRDASYYYFAFPEDYARAEQDFDERGQLVRRTHRPVFQVVFVFSPEQGTLDAAAPGGKRVVEKLMNLAVETLLTPGEPDTTKDDRVYELELLRDGSFSWNYPVAAGIAAVWAKSLRLSFKYGGDRMVLEGEGPGAVYSSTTGWWEPPTGRAACLQTARTSRRSSFASNTPLAGATRCQAETSGSPGRTPATSARTRRTERYARC